MGRIVLVAWLAGCVLALLILAVPDRPAPGTCPRVTPLVNPEYGER
jgi:hypothetical protein